MRCILNTLNDENTQVLVSIILPCFNEKDNIISLVTCIHETLHQWRHEIIVVDDNSPDGTYLQLQNHPVDYLRIFKRTNDPSLAKSIRYGIEQAKGEYLIIMDSDFNHQPKELPAMLANLAFFDCVSGSRFVYGGRMDNRFRHLASWFFNIFVRMVTKNFVTDNLYGYIAIKRTALEQLNFDEIFWGFGDYCIRLMYYLQRNKTSILQVPSVLGMRLGGSGNKAFIKTFKQYFKETIKLVLKNKRN
jgi:dolichol-phosphate mannosyltransferase